MFEFAAIRRRRPAGRSRYGASRQMRLESMEGRLMLADPGLNFTTFDQTARFYSFSEPVWTQAAPDGGLIEMHFSAARADFEHGLVRSSVAQSNDDGSPSFGGSISISDVLTDSAALIYSTDTSGIQPVVFSHQPGAEINTTLQLPTDDQLQASSSFNEGGAIAIEPIIASRELNYVQPRALHANTLADLGQERGLPSRTLAMAADIHERAVTSEWARAMVFEMAGDEPTTTNRTRVERDPSVPELTDQLETDLGAHQNDVKTTPAVLEHHAAYGHSAIPGRASAASRAAWNELAMAQAFQSEAFAMVLSAAAQELGVPGRTTSPADSAQDAAIEQLVETEDANLHWFANISRKAVGGTPLLLLLALESVTMRSSRRGSLPAARQSAWLPRKPFGKCPLAAR